MDIPNFQVPLAQRPKAASNVRRASRSAEHSIAWSEHHKKAEERIRIFHAGAFGVMRALRISPEGVDFLSILVKDAGGAQHQIVAPVSQCSFRLSIFVPTSEEPYEKIILGFAEGQNV
ncbi:MAG: hypothetical protein DLM73_06750 [Chthoniobacterales bacterium]|nr:MAG: hypothetical protein DLM73_06750 [Chthoniobacterales bacterium]